MTTRWLSGLMIAAAAMTLRIAPARAEGPDDVDADVPVAHVAEAATAPEPSPHGAREREAAEARPRRAPSRGPRADSELNRALARGGIALEIVLRLATVASAARTCAGAACDRVAGMLPVVGPATSASASPEDRALSAALAAAETTSLALAALGVWDPWSESRGRIRVALRGPGLIVAGEY